MSDALRIALNCVLVAVISYCALLAMVLVDEVVFKLGFYAAGFFAEIVPRSAFFPTIWAYDVVRFSVFGAMAAFLMLLLKPRIILLYSLASIVPLAWIHRPLWHLSNPSLFHTSLVLVWIFTIPLLYWMFSHISENRHNKPFKSAPAC